MAQHLSLNHKHDQDHLNSITKQKAREISFDKVF